MWRVSPETLSMSRKSLSTVLNWTCGDGSADAPLVSGSIACGILRLRHTVSYAIITCVTLKSVVINVCP